MKGDKEPAPLYSVWSIDAWADGEGDWTWNDKCKLFEFRSRSLNIKRVFPSKLREFLENGVRTIAGMRQYIDLGRGWYYIDGDWDILELCRRSTKEPLYACIREPD